MLCAFGALYLAFDLFRAGRRWLALALAGLAGAFLANVLYIAASRTSLVVIPVLLLFLGFRWFGWKGTLVLALAGGALGGGCLDLFAACAAAHFRYFKRSAGL